MKRTRKEPKSTRPTKRARKSKPVPITKVVSTGRGPELKVVDSGATLAQMNTTGTFILLNGTQQGNDYTNRLGRKFTCRSIYARGFITPEYDESALGAIAVPSQMGRIIVFIDKQANGAAPTTTDLLAQALPTSPLNLNNRDRFKVIFDDQFVFGPILSITTATQAQAAFGGDQIHSYHKFKKLEVEVINNAGTAGTVADIQSGSIYAFYIGSQAAGTNTDLNANIFWRIRFTDP